VIPKELSKADLVLRIHAAPPGFVRPKMLGAIHPIPEFPIIVTDVLGHAQSQKLFFPQFRQKKKGYPSDSRS
jgi:hypothetical protein